MRVHHVEMALVNRHVHRFTNGAAAVMQMGQLVHELYDVLEVFDRGVPAALVEVGDER